MTRSILSPEGKRWLSPNTYLLCLTIAFFLNVHTTVVFGRLHRRFTEPNVEPVEAKLSNQPQPTSDRYQLSVRHERAPE